jgi:hypothetical protein
MATKAVEQSSRPNNKNRLTRPLKTEPTGISDCDSHPFDEFLDEWSANRKLSQKDFFPAQGRGNRSSVGAAEALLCRKVCLDGFEPCPALRNVMFAVGR